MGHLDVQHVTYSLPDGRILLLDVSFRVGEGAITALIGANGAGKSTLMRMIAGDEQPHEGSIARTGGLGVMRQFVGHMTDGTVRDLLLTVAPPAIAQTAARIDATELAMMEDDSEKNQMAYAQAIADWADVGGYDIEVLWDVCTMAAIQLPFDQAQNRSAGSLSGGVPAIRGIALRAALGFRRSRGLFRPASPLARGIRGRPSGGSWGCRSLLEPPRNTASVSPLGVQFRW